MYEYRLTKYNPKYRDYSGVYLQEEWTLFYDVGKCFNDKKFTISEYFKVEQAYIKAVMSFMKINDIGFLNVTSLEKYSSEKEVLDNDTYLEKEEINLFRKLKNNLRVDYDDINIIMKLILREHLWCKLEHEKMFVHFGYDYYMYIGSFHKEVSIYEYIDELGLYIEEHESPY